MSTTQPTASAEVLAEADADVDVDVDVDVDMDMDVDAPASAVQTAPPGLCSLYRYPEGHDASSDAQNASMQTPPAPTSHSRSSAHENGTDPMHASWTLRTAAGKMTAAMSQASDLKLLERWRAGETSAAEELTGRYYPSVLRFFELKLPRAADDLTQRVFLACVEGQHRYDGTGTFKAYLFGIARNVLLEEVRAVEGRLTRFDEDTDAPLHTSLSTLIARRQEQQLILQALVALPTEMLVEVQLYYWEGLPTRQIAEILGTPASTVTTHLARARARLREELESLTDAGPVREQLLADVEGWVRSVVPSG